MTPTRILLGDKVPYPPTLPRGRRLPRDRDALTCGFAGAVSFEALDGTPAQCRRVCL
jgi:hypothetical protein